MTIQNDQDLRVALDTLSVNEQRALGSRFIHSVQYLCDNPVINRAIDIAQNQEHDEIEISEVYKAVKSLSIQTYTACGGDVHWAEQAAHFVAEAAVACLTPENQMGINTNLAWKTALQARMANNCEMIESNTGEIMSEAQKQYALTEKFLSARHDST